MKKKLWKRLILGLLFIVLIPPIFLWWVTLNTYSRIETADDGFVYLLRDKFKKAGIMKYTYDPLSGNETIVIPDTYGKYPVKGIGGFIGRGAPCYFYVDIKGLTSYVKASPDYSEGKNKETVVYDLTLEIGPNIKEIYSERLVYLTKNTRYVVRFYVKCDPSNSAFYSEDGILYHKNRKIVDGLLYWNQDY